jgi:hypothetical protein
METPTATVYLAYVGPCEIETDKGKAKGSKWAAMRMVGDYGNKFEPTKEEKSYSAATGKGAKVGAIYSFTAGDEAGTTIYPNSRRWVGIVDTASRVQWEASVDEKAREEEAKKIPEAMRDILAPLREEYWKRIGYAAKAAYLAKIITYITGYHK